MFILLLLLITVIINNIILPELIGVLTDSMPDCINLKINHKPGWTMTMMASMLTILSSISLIISFWSMKNNKNISSENIVIRECNPHEKTQRLYSLSAWAVPFILCCLGCSFAIVANYYPRVIFQRQPNGSHTEAISKINQNIQLFEVELTYIKRDAENECIPFATIHDLFLKKSDYSHLNDILLNPIKTFKGISDKFVHSIKETMTNISRELIGDVLGESTITTLNEFKNFNLPYLWMFFLIPRILQLLLLIYGLLTVIGSPFILNVLPQIERRSIVKAFEALCIFSGTFILGTQLAIYNFPSAFAFPFFIIEVKLGLGFIYDLICESIMLSIWIGIQNKLFFIC